MTRPSAPLKKLEKDVVRAAMRWYRRALKEGYDESWAVWAEGKAEWRACARLAQRKPSGK